MLQWILCKLLLIINIVNILFIYPHTHTRTNLTCFHPTCVTIQPLSAHLCNTPISCLNCLSTPFHWFSLLQFYGQRIRCARHAFLSFLPVTLYLTEVLLYSTWNELTIRLQLTSSLFEWLAVGVTCNRFDNFPISILATTSSHTGWLVLGW